MLTYPCLGSTGAFIFRRAPMDGSASSRPQARCPSSFLELKMKRIKLTQGQYALVDDADFIRFGNLKWQAEWNRYTKSFYAKRVGPRPKRQHISLHREILGLTDPRVKGDHENHDTLNCQRYNLRAATSSQNAMNRKGPQTNSKSGVRGVRFNRNGRWEANIGIRRKQKYLGSFLTIAAAAAAYKAANRHRFGEFGGVLS